MISKHPYGVDRESNKNVHQKEKVIRMRNETTPHCATWLHRLVPHIHLKILNSYDFSFWPLSFCIYPLFHKMYILKQKKLSLRRKALIRCKEENEKLRRKTSVRHLKKSFSIIIATVGVT